MRAKIHITYGNGEQMQSEEAFACDSEQIENHVINLYPEETFQKMEGFGGAITDAAGYVYQQMDPQQKKELMETYFSSKRMHYDRVRIPMDSCDFATDMYEAMSDPADRELKSFSFERTEKNILPMLADAQAMAETPLRIMLSPWSPPAFMKSNKKRIKGGTLKPEYKDFWADYICRYIQEFEKRGYFVERISLQNEAKAVQIWDSCVYSGEEEGDFLENHMIPALRRHGLSHVEVFIWDHNKERIYDRVCASLGNERKNMADGVAFHWYSGDHFDALDLVQRRFPDLKMIVSESCIEFCTRGEDDITKQAESLCHEIIGDLNHGAVAFYDWNILLDETGGPNHVGNLCNAPFLYQRQEKRLEAQLIQKYFEHFTHFILPGSVRIGTSCYTSRLEVSAFFTPTGKIVAVILNQGAEELPAVLRMKEQILKINVAPHSIVTLEISEEA